MRPQRASQERGPGHLLALVVSHAHAPIASWSPLILQRPAVQALLAASAEVPGLRGLAVLATCSRTELYAEVDDAGDGEALLRTLVGETLGVPPAVVGHFRALQGGEAVHHLLRVASGLASIALGEHEIVGQVRDALHAAQEGGVAGALVQRLFERALATGGRVRHDTDIGRGAISLGAAAAAAVTSTAPPSRCALAIVVGAGHMARQAARQLRDRGFGTLAIVNRSGAHAEALARDVGGRAYPLSELPALIARACVVVSAVRADAPLITPATLLHARLRLDEPLQLVDLGSPPNVSPACASIPGVRRLDLDALHARLAGAHASRASAVAQAEAIVRDEAARFLAWWRHRHLVPVARHLRERFQAEARVVVERETRHLATSEREQLERFADALLRRLLHGPLTHLRALAEQEGEPVDPLSADDCARLIVDAYLVDRPVTALTPSSS